jgi:formamidopyrimidine-DNA glycosylase
VIEIPEAVTLARQLVESLEGKRVDDIVAGASPHKFAWYYGDPERYPDIILGKTFQSACAVGGMVEAAAEDVRLLFSEGANLRFLPAGSTPPKKHQLLVTFSDGSMLAASVQMYGGVGVFPEGALDNEYYLVARETPSPMSRQFDRQYFHGLISNPEVEKLSAKALLATEQRIPGLGNGVLQDILFEARVHPKRKIRELDEDSRARIFSAVKDVLREMADGGGRDTERDLFGNPGGYTTRMSRNTVGKPCRSCGSLIGKKAYMGGSVYYCPGCQPE